MKAIRLVLSYSEDLRGKEVLHRTDNRNAKLALSVGSRNKDIACVAHETKPRFSPSANQRPEACSTDLP